MGIDIEEAKAFLRLILEKAGLPGPFGHKYSAFSPQRTLLFKEKRGFMKPFLSLSKG